MQFLFILDEFLVERNRPPAEPSFSGGYLVWTLFDLKRPLAYFPDQICEGERVVFS